MSQEAYFERGKEIVQLMNQYAYEAYFIGGLVRDYLLKRPFKDIDIATSATPEQIKEIFPNAIMDFASNGCTIIKEGSFIYEISTFREEEYLKSRTPTYIYYSDNLKTDVIRRDFTINAIAMTDNLKIVDLVGGEKDLRKKTIRIIGRGKKRFNEDPLRILRAFDLVSSLDFKIEKQTAKAIVSCSKLLNEVSNYKASEIIEKIFNAPFGKKAIKKMVELSTNQGLIDYNKGLKIVAKHYDKLSIAEKLAICYIFNGSIPENTCFDKILYTKIKTIMKAYEQLIDKEVTRVTIFEHGVDTLIKADRIATLINRKYKSQLKQINRLSSDLPISQASDMVFRGNDLVELAGGKTGPFISEIIEKLRQKVIMGEINNEYVVLKKEAEILLAKIDFNNLDDNLLNNELNDLLNEYLKEFNHLVDINMKEIGKEYTLNHSDEVMSTSEENQLLVQVKLNVKNMLLIKNPNYKELDKRGKI